MSWLTEVSWSPYAVGVGIGILSWFTWLVSGKPISCSTTFARSAGLIERTLRGSVAETRPFYREIRLAVDWQGTLVLGIVAGAFVSAILSGDHGWRWVPSTWAAAFGADPAGRLAVALLGGTALGFGARWANGCTSGHGISGTMQLAISSWVSAVCFFVGGIIAAHLLFATVR